MPVMFNLSDDGTQINIQVSGRFNFSVYKDFRDACKEAARHGNIRYVIDLAETEYMDSSALGMLLLLRERSGGDGADIRIVHCRPEIRKVLSIANFERLFQVG